MDKKTFITIDEIKSLLPYFYEIKNERLNKYYKSLPTQGQTKSPQYTLSEIEFNMLTRVAHIKFLRSQEYRTIIKYITQNYQKYPIYSNWKLKEKRIQKTIKLTNLELESLNNNKDELIRMFAEEIILNINKKELFPSWFINLFLKIKLDSTIKKMTDYLHTLNYKQNNRINLYQQDIAMYNEKIKILNDCLLKNSKKQNRYINKLNKIQTAKNIILKTIFTLGIYKIFISDRRKLTMTSKLVEVNNYIMEIQDKILNNRNQIKNCEAIINECRLGIVENGKKFEQKKNELTNNYKTNITMIKPLPNKIAQDKSFIMLNSFNGLEYEKIIGVYIIHNREKDKYYVGQSKDVFKRIKQHFNNTIPKNQIFAEDYYTSKLPNKENLFELKIFKCKTKDELDTLEKKLIYEYDSWNNGYNGTSGNI